MKVKEFLEVRTNKGYEPFGLLLCRPRRGCYCYVRQVLVSKGRLILTDNGTGEKGTVEWVRSKIMQLKQSHPDLLEYDIIYRDYADCGGFIKMKPIKLEDYWTCCWCLVTDLSTKKQSKGKEE